MILKVIWELRNKALDMKPCHGISSLFMGDAIFQNLLCMPETTDTTKLCVNSILPLCKLAVTTDKQIHYYTVLQPKLVTGS